MLSRFLAFLSLNCIASLSYAARPAFNDLLQGTPSLQPAETMTQPISIGAESLFQSASNSTVGSNHDGWPWSSPSPTQYDGGTISNMIQNEGFADLTKQFANLRSAWETCQAEILEKWDAYNSEYYLKGHMIWVKGLPGYGRDIMFCQVQGTYEDSLDVTLLNDQHQPIKEEEFTFNIKYEQIESESGSLPDLIQQIIGLPCVRGSVATLQTTISNAIRSVGKYLAYKLRQFGENGYLKLAFGFGASWRGSGLLPHSLRVEGGLGVVVWPPKIAGTITHEFCAGKDSNRKAVDVSISLEVGFDNSCFRGYSLFFAGALQLPAGREIVGGFGVDCDAQNMCMEDCIANGGSKPVCFPRLDSFAIGYGQSAFIDTISSLWKKQVGLSSSWAVVGVGCREGELLKAGEVSDCS